MKKCPREIIDPNTVHKYANITNLQETLSEKLALSENQSVQSIT